MLELIDKLIDTSTILITNGTWITGFILVFIESFFPILPLGAFVTLNINAFGSYQGLIISWIATTTGSFLTYLISYYISNKLIYKFLSNRKKEALVNIISSFEKIPITVLTLLITLPFSPSSFINLLAGITKIKQEKYLISLIIGKALMVTFWAYIGRSIIRNITDLKTIIFIILLLLIAYIITKIFSKKLKIE